MPEKIYKCPICKELVDGTQISVHIKIKHKDDKVNYNDFRLVEKDKQLELFVAHHKSLREEELG